MWGRLKDFVLQDVKNENEIKMYAVILRMGLLVMFLYYGITMTGAVMMNRSASLIAAGVGVLLSAVLFGSTYHNRTKAAAVFFILSFSVLILVSVLMYGNYTGVFHFMYVQIALLYALDYMPFAGKAVSTVLLVAFRIGLFHYVERVGTFYIIANDELSLRQGLHIVITCLLLLVIVSASTQDFREMQEKLVSYVDPENHRQAKANESYYLLKKTEVPIVIVECGFLSNWEEAKKLQEDSYQNQIAWAVAMGILSYLEEGTE